MAIATSGRAAILNETLRELSAQALHPAKVFVCPAQLKDFAFPPDETLPFPIEVVEAPPGACRQRNAILDRLDTETAGIVVFLDDDFFPAPDYLGEAARLFADNPDIVVATGCVVADGAPGPGLSVEEARALLDADVGAQSLCLETLYNGYGCNMAVRLSVVNGSAFRFDDALPLYAWLEDVDFSRRLAEHGRIVRASRLRGVHLGAKRGRGSGLRLGYSQIANPWYLARKGTMRADLALRQALRNLVANVAKVARPEPWVDRRGRVKGNLLALGDLLTGRLHPGRILSLE